MLSDKIVVPVVLHFINGLAVNENSHVNVGVLAVHSGSVAINGHKFSPLLTHTGEKSFDLVVRGLLLFLLDLESFIVGKSDLGEMFKLDGVIERGVTLKLGIVINGNTGNGGHLKFTEHCVDMNVNEILAGVMIKLALEALLNDIRGDMALAETIHGDASLLQFYGRIDGGVNLIGLNRNINLFFAGGEFFCSIFHRKLLQNSLWCERGDLNPHA